MRQPCSSVASRRGFFSSGPKGSDNDTWWPESETEVQWHPFNGFVVGWLSSGKFNVLAGHRAGVGQVGKRAEYVEAEGMQQGLDRDTLNICLLTRTIRDE